MPRPATPPSIYVQQHLPLLTAYSKGRRFRPWFCEPDDFLQALVLAVLEKHSQFRPQQGKATCQHCGGSGCSTWLGWQARAVLRDLLRQHDTDKARIEIEAPVAEAALVPAAWGSHKAMQDQAQVAQVLRIADLCQRDACMTVLADCDGATVQRLLGIQLHGRNYRLRRLAATLNDNPPEDPDAR